MSPADRRNLRRLRAERDRARAEYLRATREIYRDLARRRSRLLSELDRANAVYCRTRELSSRRGRETERGEADAEPLAGSEPPEFEPLSEREVEVLQLLAAGLSRPQVAAALFVSLNTVKTHARHLYRKLDAHNRIEALARAKALNLIHTGLRPAP